MERCLARSILFFGIVGRFHFDGAIHGNLTPTGNLIIPREYHSATLLTDGKVLITGGRAGTTAWSSAELYDPATGMLTSTGDMTSIQNGHTATLLPNGEVLIAGGESALNDSRSALAAAELYDLPLGRSVRRAI